MKLFFFVMKGSILVSSPSLLSDMVFYKSIILIVDESDNSHTGFILNKPGGLFFLKNESGKLNRNYKFGFGGPVSGETFFIIKNHNLYSQNLEINKNLFWGNDVEMVINEIENKKILPKDVLFLVSLLLDLLSFEYCFWRSFPFLIQMTYFQKHSCVDIKHKIERPLQFHV